MESTLEILGILFFMLLVLSAAVEVVLESFRGLLERFGVTWMKSKVSLEQSLALAKEFLPSDAAGQAEVMARVEAVKAAAGQLGETVTTKLLALDELKKNLEGGGLPVDALGQLNAVAAQVSLELTRNERARVFTVRFLAAVLGCLLVWMSHFHVFELVANTEIARSLMSQTTRDALKGEVVNIFAGGLAAGAGSSYWHDQLDKVRSLKAAAGNIKTLRSR